MVDRERVWNELVHRQLFASKIVTALRRFNLYGTDTEIYSGQSSLPLSVLIVALWPSNREINKKWQRKCQISHRCGITDRLFVGNHLQLVAKTVWDTPKSPLWSGLVVRLVCIKCFFSLLMKWNGRPRTIGCSVFCIAKIGVNQPKINDSGVGGVECMFRSGYLGTRVDGSKK